MWGLSSRPVTFSIINRYSTTNTANRNIQHLLNKLSINGKITSHSCVGITSKSCILQVEAFADCCREDCRLEFPLIIGSFPIQNTNAQTGGIVVTQQPTKGLPNGQHLGEAQFDNKGLSELSQMQNLLIKEGASSSDAKNTTIAISNAIPTFTMIDGQHSNL